MFLIRRRDYDHTGQLLQCSPLYYTHDEEVAKQRIRSHASDEAESRGKDWHAWEDTESVSGGEWIVNLVVYSDRRMVCYLYDKIQELRLTTAH